MRFGVVALICLGYVVATSPAQAIEGTRVLMQGLDKVTARIYALDVAIGQTVRFGTLNITLRSCDRTPPEEPPESAAFLDIIDAKVGGDETRLFSGWMYASSPALSALEHPVYDVWVVECVVPPQVETDQ